VARQHHRTVVRREHPVRKRAVRLSVFCGLVLGLFVVYQWGLRSGSAQLIPLNDGSEVLLERIGELETRSALDKQALGDLTLKLAESRGVIDELEGELAFYREVMAPEERRQGVVVRAPRFIATSDPLRWRYAVVVQQGRPTEARFAGELRLRVVGRALGEMRVLPLADLDDGLAGEPLPVNFRYFQRFEGELLLPPEFTPERVEIDVVLQKPRSDEVSVAHDWSRVMVYTSVSDQ